jgi:Plasmid pRiA4b ORF-3-like protein
MGWHDTHRYSFENDDYTIVDPDSDMPGISADDERLVSIATEPGQQFSYLYDFGDSWWHTVTLEEIRAAGPENTFRAPVHLRPHTGSVPWAGSGGLRLRLQRALLSAVWPIAIDMTDGGDICAVQQSQGSKPLGQPVAGHCAVRAQHLA